MAQKQISFIPLLFQSSLNSFLYETLSKQVMRRVDSFELKIITNKKSHWFHVSDSKLLGDQSGDSQITFFDNTCKKRSKIEKVNINIELYMFEIV